MAAINWVNQSSYLYSAKLNKEFQMAAQPLLRFRQFLRFKEAFGKNVGETVNWMQVANIGTYGGTLTETNTMHESDYTMAWGTCSVKEYGNSIPFTYKVTTLSEFELKRIIRETLLNDAVKCIDGEIERQFNATLLRYVGTSTTGGVTTTDGTATATNTSALNTTHVRKLMTQLKSRNVPGWTGLNGDYSMICSVEAMENMRAALESVFQYTESGTKKLLAGEVGRYMGCRFVEDTFATRYTYDSAARSATAKTWTKASSLEGYMFGSPTVREAIVVPEEVRAKEPSDYGRSHGLAWYMIAGWKIEWATSGGGDSRIIKWDSKA